MPDEWVERTLLASGVVSAAAIEHARGLRARGFEHCRLEELLVDLGHVHPEALARAFSAALGTPMWDERDLDPEVAQSFGERRGLILGRDGPRARFATTAPYDDALADQARFATGAVEAVPLVTTEAGIQRGRRHARGAPPAPSNIEASEPDALERLTNLLLLDHVIGAPGACVRVRDFQPPGLERGENGHFGTTPEGWDTLPAALYAPIARRLRYMAMGNHSQEDQSGWIVLSTGPSGRAHSLQMFGRKTLRGGVVVVQRQACWYGQWPEGAAWEQWRRCVQSMQEAHRKKDGPRLVEAAQNAVGEADAMGPLALLEQLATRQDLASFLLDEARYGEAREVAERALELCREAGLGARVEGHLEATVADCIIDDLDQRIRGFEHAESLLSAAGVGRVPTASLLCAMAHAENAAGRPERALQYVERTIAMDEAWFGAITEAGHDALVEASLAQTSLGNIGAAREKALRARAAASAMKLSLLPAAWALARAARVDGRAEAARTTLLQALAEAGEECGARPFAQGELALILEETGDSKRARQLATEALELLAPRGAATGAVRRDLEALLHRAGPYR